MVATNDFLWIAQFDLGFRQSRCQAGDRFTGPLHGFLHLKEVETHGAGF